MQQLPVGLLLGRNPVALVPGDRAEEVEGGSHIQLPPRFQVDNGKIDGAAPGVAGSTGNIACPEKLPLVDVGVVI